LVGINLIFYKLNACEGLAGKEIITGGSCPEYLFEGKHRNKTRNIRLSRFQLVVIFQIIKEVVI